MPVEGYAAALSRQVVVTFEQDSWLALGAAGMQNPAWARSKAREVRYRHVGRELHEFARYRRRVGR